MPLSEEIRGLLAHVRSSELVTNDTCTAISAGLLELLGVGDLVSIENDRALLGLRNPDPTDDGIYELRIDLGNPQTWQHGLVLLKHGREVILLQGWVGQFSLGSWLDTGTGVGGECFAHYSPGSDIFDTGNMTAWLTVLEQLPGTYEEGVDALATALTNLFGARMDRQERAQLLMNHRAGYGLHCHWRYQRLAAFAGEAPLGLPGGGHTLAAGLQYGCCAVM